MSNQYQVMITLTWFGKKEVSEYYVVASSLDEVAMLVLVQLQHKYKDYIWIKYSEPQVWSSEHSVEVYFAEGKSFLVQPYEGEAPEFTDFVELNDLVV